MQKIQSDRKSMPLDPTSIRSDANRFLKAHSFIERLRRYSDKITMLEYKNMRNMALNGDLEGAENKLQEILNYRQMRGKI